MDEVDEGTLMRPDDSKKRHDSYQPIFFLPLPKI